MAAIATHFRPRQNNLKSKVRLNLPPQTLQRLAEKLLHLATTQTKDMRMFLLAARLHNNAAFRPPDA